ncbi:MAG: hypothetical protein ACHQ51_03325 [Elusimicrobiota bacterium]
MRTKILIAALAALALSGSARAEDAKPAPKDSIMTFFRHLRESLSQSAVQGERKKASRHSPNSVAAVRGEDQSSTLADPNEPTLLGDARSKKDKAAMAEDAEIAKGVDLILAGKTEAGVKALEAFKAAHPKSHAQEVSDAIERAKALPAAKPAEAAAAPEPAKPEAPKVEAPKPEAPKDAAPDKK